MMVDGYANDASWWLMMANDAQKWLMAKLMMLNNGWWWLMMLYALWFNVVDHADGWWLICNDETVCFLKLFARPAQHISFPKRQDLQTSEMGSGPNTIQFGMQTSLLATTSLGTYQNLRGISKPWNVSVKLLTSWPMAAYQPMCSHANSSDYWY